MKKIIYLSCLLFWGTSGFLAAQITSSEVMSNAKAYLNFDWTATSANIWEGVNCGGKTVDTPGWVTAGDHTAMAYCWGGNSTLSQYNAYLLEGKSAGDNNTSAGYGAEPGCSIGVDCSGFVSRCFGLNTHYSTSMLNVNELFGHHSSYAELHESDFINNPGSHTRLVTKINANGTISVTESGSGVGNVGSEGLWRVFTWTYNLSQLTQYNPQYYTGMTSGSAALDCSNAVPVFCGVTYEGSPSAEPSAISFYGCNSWTETGPERVHTITPAMDGTLRATISDFSGDLDVYILGSCDPSDCLGILTSNDAIYANVLGGHTYYIVVDSDDGSESGYKLLAECLTSEDISITNVSASPTVLEAGGQIEVSADQNYAGPQSGADLPGFTLAYYLSADCDLSPEDVLLGTDDSDLGYDQPLVSETEVLTVPEETLPGSYYLIFAGDAGAALNEVNEDNNTACVAIEITSPNTVADPTFQHQISVFPNPTRDVIQIVSLPGQEIEKLLIYDLNGRLVKTIEGSHLNKLEIRELPAGPYLLEVVGAEDKLAVFRIVKD